MNSGLSRLIECLERGTRLHISVVFPGGCRIEKLILPQEHKIHTSSVCAYFKESATGFRGCLRNRGYALEKAIRTGADFYGQCIHGVCEYVRPVTSAGQTVAVIFIGNIFERQGKREYRCAAFSDRMECGCSREECEQTALVLEEYILTALKTEPQMKDKGGNPAVESLKTELADGMKYDMSIKTMAPLVGYNPKYLGSVFRNEVGMTVSQYKNVVKMDRAAELLKNTGMTVLEVSLMCGYNNVSYFNRVFLRRYGLCPTAFRETEKNGNR